MHPALLSKSSAGQTEVIRERAIEIASIEAARLGYDLKSMNVSTIQQDTPWNMLFPKDSKSDYDIERQERLAGKKYWLIYFSTKQNRMGGDLGVFIDFNTGEIITLYRGK
jgi:hypothetical protein